MSLILDGTNGLSDIDGSAATPAIRGTDANTGIFFPAADTIAFTEGGAESMRIDSSGNLGLGVTPSAWGRGKALEVGSVGNGIWSDTGPNDINAFTTNAYLVNSSIPSGWRFAYSGYAVQYRQTSGQHQWYTSTASGTAGNTITFTQAMTLDASGRLLLGTTTGSENLIVSAANARQRISSTTTTNAVATLYGNSNNYFYVGRDDSSGGYFNSGSAYSACLYSEGAYPMAFFTNATERARIDSSGRVCIGGTTVTDTHLLNIQGSTATHNIGIVLNKTNATAQIWGITNTGPLAFYDYTASAERMRIDSSGNLLVGKTSVDNNPGIALRPTGEGYFVRSGADVLSVNRLSSDGQLVVFYQDTVSEGNISVSGTTVSYNGGHLSRWAQTTTAKDDSIVKGTVLSNLDEMNVYTKDGQPVDNEQLNKVKVSDTEGDVNVAGVFVNWSHDDAHNVDEINMAMTGDMIIRIAQGTTVQRGDLLMSAGDGTAKPQGDDIVRSKTVAKVTSNHITCTYADGSYCVPCVLMAC